MSYYSRKFDERIVELLKTGAVGVLPTDTIYGLSALALNEKSVNRVHALKRKSRGRPLIVLISDTAQLPLIGINIEQASYLEQYWPAPLSIEFNAKHSPAWLHRGSYFFAVRMPNNNELRSLIRNVGPIVSTSANLTGKKPAITVDEAKKYFGGKLDFYVDVGKLQGSPSTLAKLKDGKLEVIRQGSYELKS
jgi:L-threonylcarbamoyladenylate synthase